MSARTTGSCRARPWSGLPPARTTANRTVSHAAAIATPPPSASRRRGPTVRPPIFCASSWPSLRSTARSTALASPAARPPRTALSARRAFTLVELIVVMVLLLIVAAMVSPRMSSFFQGRALSSEAQRLLSLMHYAQSRAVAEGSPVILWLNPAKSTYGLETQAGHESSDDRRDLAYTADPSVTFDLPAVASAPVSEDGDETFGFPEGLPSIRFNPDGHFDDVTVSRIILRQGTQSALELAPKSNRLSYEIRPAALPPQ